MSAAERARLARILGMLGSEHAGERAAAALQAEAFRKRHGLTWEGMLSLPAIPMEQWARPAWVPPEPRPKAPEPPPPPASTHDPHAHAPSWARPDTRPPDPLRFRVPLTRERVFIWAYGATITAGTAFLCSLCF
jgi:hypothetical protein